MKKWTSLLLALAMALSLAACGNSGTQENTSEPPASVSGSIAEETPAPHRHGSARRRTGRGAVGGTCRE